MYRPPFCLPIHLLMDRWGSYHLLTTVDSAVMNGSLSVLLGAAGNSVNLFEKLPYWSPKQLCDFSQFIGDGVKASGEAPTSHQGPE